MVLIPLSLYATYLYSGEVAFEMKTESLSDSWTMFKQIAFCYLIEDVSFYFLHRMLHMRFFMRHIHYIHHQYFVTIGIASEYAHPVEMVLGNNLPFILGPMIIGKKCHLFTVLCWMFLRVTGTIEGHCGYEFPFQLIAL